MIVVSPDGVEQYIESESDRDDTKIIYEDMPVPPVLDDEPEDKVIQPKRKRGRPRKTPEVEPKVEVKVQKTKMPKPKLEPHDFTAGLNDFVDAVWYGTGSIPVPQMQVTSALLGANKDQIVSVINAGAQSNRFMRGVANSVAGDKVSENAWVLGAGMLGWGIYQQTQVLKNNPEILVQVIEANQKNIADYATRVFGIAQPEASKEV